MQSLCKLIAIGVMTGAALTGAAGSALGAPATFRGIDEDAQHVVFTTAERMVPEDIDAAVDVYERVGGTTVLVSTGPTGGNAQIDATFRGIEGFPGDRIVFQTAERLTADDLDNSVDVYIREDGQTERASRGGNQFPGNGNFDADAVDMTSDGTVVIETDEKLADDDTDANRQDVYIYEQSIGMVSQRTNASAANGAFDANYNSEGSGGAAIYFTTAESLDADDDDTAADIYALGPNGRELASDTVGEGESNDPVVFGGVGAGGTFVVFETDEQWDVSDSDSAIDVFSYDVGTNTSGHVTTGFGDAEIDIEFAGVPLIDDEVYVETTENLGADVDDDVDVYEIDGVTETRISADFNQNFDANFEGVDDDGDHVAWSTQENVINAQDGDNAADLYETEGITTRVISRGPLSGPDVAPVFRGYAADGSRALFSTLEKLTADDTDASADVYARVNETTTEKVTPGNGAQGVIFGAASEDASAIAYTTLESLAPQDPDAEADVYKTAGATTTLESYELVPPDTTITLGPPGATNDNTPEFAFTSNEASTSFVCSFDGATFTPCGFFSPVADGNHTFQVQAVDAAGNADPTPASSQFKVDTTGPAVRISGKARRATRKGVFRVPLTCPAGETGGCSGRLVLVSDRRLRVGPRRLRHVRFANQRFSLAPGQTKAIRIKLSRKNRARLRRARKIRLDGRATAQDGLGNQGRSAGKLTLRAARR
jgi:hypothetical protein